MLAVQISRTGGPEVLEAVEVEVPSPAAGQILVRHAAVGLNYIDTYQSPTAHREAETAKAHRG